MQVRADSANAVLNALRSARDGRTREELMELTGLSRSTIASVFDELGDLLEQTDAVAASGRPGPSAQRFRLSSHVVHAGVDVGRRHVTVALGTAAGTLFKRREPFRSSEAMGPSALAVAASELHRILKLEGIAAHRLATVGLGIPAPLTPDGRIASADAAPGWPVKELAPLFQRALRDLDEDLHPEVLAANDANTGVYGEVVYGAARGARSAAFVKASSGIGLGVWCDGLYRGGHGFAGEFGHVSVAYEVQEFIASHHPELVTRKQRCPRCQQLTCVENLCAATAIVGQLVEAYPEHFSPGLQFKDVLKHAIEDPVNHERCVRAIEYAGRRLGAALADLTRILDPEVIVIGGFLAEARPLIEDRLRESVTSATLNGAPSIAYVPSEDIEYTEARGALAMAVDQTGLSYLDDSRTIETKLYDGGRPAAAPGHTDDPAWSSSDGVVAA